MKKALFVTTCIFAVTLSQNVQAQDFLDRMDSMLGKVESSINKAERTTDRATGTAKRLNDKIPEAGGNQKAPAQTTAEEQRILNETRRIEEERILHEAEAIRSRQQQSSENADTLRSRLNR